MRLQYALCNAMFEADVTGASLLIDASNALHNIRVYALWSQPKLSIPAWSIRLKHLAFNYESLSNFQREAMLVCR